MLRTGDFVGHDVVAAGFMRSSVVREHGHPLRFANHFSAAVFSGAVLSAASVGIEDEDGTVFFRACTPPSATFNAKKAPALADRSPDNLSVVRRHGFSFESPQRFVAFFEIESHDAV